MAITKNMLILPSLILSCFIAYVPILEGAQIAASSAAYSEVAAAISIANRGDTVIVPSGIATWNSPLIITKGLTLKGAGIGNTVITSNITDQNAGVIKYAPSSPELNEPFRITGFTLDCNQKSNGIYLANSKVSSINNKIRVDNNRIIRPGGTNAGRCIVIFGSIYGVIDNNIIERGSLKGIDSYGVNSTEWADLSQDFGSVNNIYFEDNTIVGDGTSHSSGHGGRYVARYNSYSGYEHNATPMLDAHGNQSAGYSTMVVEVYGNLFDFGGLYGGQMLDHRGGQGLVFFNSAINTGQTVNAVKVREEYSDATYPVTNSYRMHVTNSYYWNNRKNAGALVTAYIAQDPSDGVTNNFPPVLTEDREFFQQKASFDGTSGVGCGPLVSRPATCTPGVGYWATDQPCSAVDPSSVGINPTNPISGTLYKCMAPDTWTSYYTPYQYPHPLRVLAAPSSLRIKNQ